MAAVESPSVDARREARERASGQEHEAIVFSEGTGSNVTDVDGNRYVDLVAGFGALLLGHRPPAVARALAEQEGRLWLALGDVYGSDVKLALCDRLARLYPEPGARVMLGSTGADAVTAALKTAVLATGRSGVLAFDRAYHGLSHGPLAACGLRPGFRLPFAEQLNPHTTFVPYPYDEESLASSLAAVERALAEGTFGAVLVEPILGRGGCVVPPRGFVAQLSALARKFGALLVCDEIWTGLGRSGAWLKSVADGAIPDVVCLGKGLGAGLPISACIGSHDAMRAWGAHGGTTLHTATHFGAPLACAAALATLDAVASEGLVERAKAVGDRWMSRLRDALADRRDVEVRGQGLMVGIELKGQPTRALSAMRTLLQHGWIVLTGGTEGETITLTPPLNIDESLLQAFAIPLREALTPP